MKKTVDFYTGVLGMPLTKTIELPGGMVLNVYRRDK
jgi:catechol 2,3-dioxygenase-like lactoylglutathione lyase family enzyme